MQGRATVRTYVNQNFETEEFWVHESVQWRTAKISLAIEKQEK